MGCGDNRPPRWFSWGPGVLLRGAGAKTAGARGQGWLPAACLALPCPASAWLRGPGASRQKVRVDLGLQPWVRMAPPGTPRKGRGILVWVGWRGGGQVHGHKVGPPLHRLWGIPQGLSSSSLFLNCAFVIITAERSHRAGLFRTPAAVMTLQSLIFKKAHEGIRSSPCGGGHPAHLSCWA